MSSVTEPATAPIVRPSGALYTVLALAMVIAWISMVLAATLMIEGQQGTSTIGLGSFEVLTVQRHSTYRGDSATHVYPHHGTWVLAAGLVVLLVARRTTTQEKFTA